MIMLNHNIWHVEHVKTIIMTKMTRHIYMYISLIMKFRKPKTKLFKFQEQYRNWFLFTEARKFLVLTLLKTSFL